MGVRGQYVLPTTVGFPAATTIKLMHGLNGTLMDMVEIRG